MGNCIEKSKPPLKQKYGNDRASSRPTVNLNQQPDGLSLNSTPEKDGKFIFSDLLISVYRMNFLVS